MGECLICGRSIWHSHYGREIMPATTAPRELDAIPHPDDCPCCGSDGYVKDGICVSCGWGDLDHRRRAEALYLLTQTVLPRLQVSSFAEYRDLATNIEAFLDDAAPATIREPAIPLWTVTEHQWCAHGGRWGCNEFRCWEADSAARRAPYLQYIDHLKAVAGMTEDGYE